jgi:hypothetical protein
MPVGIFLDREHKPSGREIGRITGTRYVLHKMLVDFMRKNYQLDGALSYGGRSYGWNLWFRSSGKTLLNLFPQKGYLVAQVVLGKEQIERAFGLRLGKNVAAAFTSASQFRDGRWVYAPVKTKRDAEDVEALVMLKRKPAPAKK